MHWFIISIIVFVIVILQIKVFGKTISKLNVYEKSFNDDEDEWQIGHSGGVAQIIPKSLNDIYCQIEEKKIEKELLTEEINKTGKRLEKKNAKLELAERDELGNILDTHLFELISKDEAKMNELCGEMTAVKKSLTELESLLQGNIKCQNIIQKKYVDSINQYLEKNKNRVTDFHLIKNIVDRNCDASEDEIHTQVPMPLYLGLVGTMVGIIVGVIYLVSTDALHNLLTPYPVGLKITELQYNEIASRGVEALLGGVGVAMISSIVGIILTTIGSWKVKNCILYVESKKNDFLSWMQAELLPTLTNDAASALEKLSENLSAFNDEFAEHTSELSATLATVQDTTDNQARLLTEINNLNISKIARANIEVYDKLKYCTDEIGKIGDYIGNINLYLNAIKELTEKLDNADERVKLIEEMAHYFKDEKSNLDLMKAIVSHNIGSVDAYFSEASTKLRESVSQQYKELIKHSGESLQQYERVMDEQQLALEKKCSQLSNVVDELRNLGSIKTLMSNMEKATREQNHRLNSLSESIARLVDMKTGSELQKSDNNWFKYAVVGIGGVTSLSLILIVLYLFFGYSYI